MMIIPAVQDLLETRLRLETAGDRAISSWF